MTLGALCIFGMLWWLTIPDEAPERGAPGTREPEVVRDSMAAVFGAAALWAVPSMLYGVVTVLAWWFVQRIRREGKRAIPREVVRCAAILAGTAALAVVLYAPVIIVSGLRSLTSNKFVVPLTLGQLPFTLERELALLLAEWTANTPLPVVILAATGIVLDTARRIRERTTPSLLVVSLLVLPVFVVLQRVAPPARTLLVFLPFAWMSAASGLVPVARRLVGASRGRRAATLAAAATLLVAWVLRSGQSQYIASRDIEEETVVGGEEFSRQLLPLLRPGDNVVTAFPASQAIHFGLLRAGGGRFFKEPKQLAGQRPEGQRLVVVTHEGNRRTTVDDARVFKPLHLEPSASAKRDTLLRYGTLTAVAITGLRSDRP